MQTSAKVTILVPFLQVDKFLFEAIQSIKTNDEVLSDLLLVGPSTISQREKRKVLTFSHKLGIETTLLLSPSRNVAGALNAGLREVKTEFIARFDADDVMLSSRLSKQLDYLRNNPDVIVIGGQISLISAKGWPVLLPRVKYPTAKQDLRNSLMRGCYIAHPATMLRTEPILRLGGYREWYDSAEDYDLWLRVLEIGELANLESKVIKYRQHKNQASRKVQNVTMFTQAAKLDYENRNSH